MDDDMRVASGADPVAENLDISQAYADEVAAEAADIERIFGFPVRLEEDGEDEEEAPADIEDFAEVKKRIEAYTKATEKERLAARAKTGLPPGRMLGVFDPHGSDAATAVEAPLEDESGTT